MKINSYPHLTAHARPDYDKLERISARGNTAQCIAIAKQLILDGHGGCRACDNCFESGDSESVVCALIAHAIQNQSFRRALAAEYSPANLTDGLPTRWLETYYARQGQQLTLSIA